MSIKLSSIAKPAVPKLKADVEPLTQEKLEQYWSETAQELGLNDLLAQRKVTMGEHGRFDIEAPGSYFETEFKPHQVAVMQKLRDKSGMPMLNCHILVKRQAVESVAYQPQEKYEAMRKINPDIDKLRKIFDELDY